MNKIKQNLSTIIIIAVVAIAVIFFGIVLKNQADKKAEAIKLLTVMETNDKKEWAKGKLDSKVIVTEFADFQCPACKVYFDNVEQKLASEYADKVKFVFAHYPLTTIHAYAYQAAEAAEVAGHMGGIEVFWKYHDKLYTTQNSSGTSLSLENLVSYAGELGLDITKFRSELLSHKYAGNINTDMKVADTLQITGTPSIFVNGVQVVNSYEAIKTAIEAELVKN